VTSSVAPARVGRGRSRARQGLDSPLRMVITSRGERVTTYALLILMAVMFAFPLYAAVQKSLEVNGWRNYVYLFTDPIGVVPIWQTYINTFVIGLLHAALVLAIATSAGYAFSRLRFRGREVTFSLVLLFLAIPGVALIVPVYRITQELGLFNTHLGVALPEAALTIPFGVLLLRNQGNSMPGSLFEAASIDGATHLRKFVSIFLPIARPALINLTVLCFVWSLQDFLWPSFVFTDPNMVSAAQAVQAYAGSLEQGPAEIAKYNASLVVLALPAVAIVLFGLRFLVSGLTSGASKE
jgi:raffinose/stachyose/melibiose transport system permease protein